MFKKNKENKENNKLQIKNNKKSPKIKEHKRTEKIILNQKLSPGILKKEEEKKLNSKIRKLINNLNKTLSAEQIKYLINKSLDKKLSHLNHKELEKKLEHEIKKLNLDIKNNKHKEELKVKRNILKLKKILEKELNQDNLNEIVKELNEINDLKIDKLKSYLTSKIKILNNIVQTLEKSELGENLFKDIAGVILGLADSGYMIGKLIKDFIVDLFVLIKNPIKEFKKFKKIKK